MEILEVDMDHTRKLARFCAGVSINSLPPEVIHKAKLCMLDYVANIYGSLELEAVEKVVSYIKSLGTGGVATALACDFTTDLHKAAFINGTTAEAIEAQDGLRFGGNHPGAAVIPAALAVAEDLKVGGKEIIEAIVAGYEAANRPAAAMHPWHTLSGFLPTGTCGAFGAAAAAARLRGFDEQCTASALGNAGYLLPLSMAEHLMGGFTIKIVQGGQAAASGLMAAGLAGAGVTGPPYVLEGSQLNGGFTKITTAAEPKNERISEGLGEQFSISDVYFKPFTACRHTHGSAQAILELSKEQGILPGDVDSLHVFTYGIAELAVGKGIDEKGTFVNAQFSIPYVVAACLLDGELGPKQFTQDRLTDPDLLALSRKVSVSTDEELNSLYPEKTASRVEITLNDGTKLAKQIDVPKGDPRDPMDAEALSEKVKNFAGNRSKQRLEQVTGLILEMENLRDIRILTECI
jgi:2-methylcitrate dehydratase PrpD